MVGSNNKNQCILTSPFGDLYIFYSVNKVVNSLIVKFHLMAEAFYP